MLDPRLLRVGIEVGGALKTYEGLEITASGTKAANAIQNECEVKVSNLDRATRDYLLTETSPFNKSKSPKLLIVEAGRVSTGYSLVFSGDITNATGGQPPDISLTLKAATGDRAKGVIVAASQPGVAPLENVARSVADTLGLTLIFQAKPKNISNFSFTGASAKLVDQLATLGRVNAYVDDGALVVKDYNVPLNNLVREVNLDTGMVGIPEFTEQGIKVKMLFDPAVVLGGGLRVLSLMNPAANGIYTVSKLSFELTSRDTAFYYIAEATRVGEA
jgi:hypothetical protein